MHDFFEKLIGFLENFYTSGVQFLCVHKFIEVEEKQYGKSFFFSRYHCPKCDKVKYDLEIRR